MFVCSLSYSADRSADKVLTEGQYIEKINNSMGGTTKTPDTNSTNTKLNMSKGYFDYLKIVIVLALVVGAIYLVFLFIRKTMKIQTDSNKEVTSVLSAHSLGPGKWVEIVFVGGKYLVLGVTNDNINLITEITDMKEIERLEIIANSKKSEEGHSFVDIVGDYFKKNIVKEKKKEFDYEEDSVDFLQEQKERLNRLGDKGKD